MPQARTLSSSSPHRAVHGHVQRTVIILLLLQVALSRATRDGAWSSTFAASGTHSHVRRRAPAQVAVNKQQHQVEQYKDHRALALERLAGYLPRSQVTDQAALDLDVKSLLDQLALGAWVRARNLYQYGGHSKSYARLTLTYPSGNGSFPAGTLVSGLSIHGLVVEGHLLEDIAWSNAQSTAPAETSNSTDDTMSEELSIPPDDDVRVLVQYATRDVQAAYVGCQVGALGATGDEVLKGCFNNTGILTIGDEQLAYQYNLHRDNVNGRTLKRLSALAKNSMKPCQYCPYIRDYKLFLDYYGDTDYADRWISAALVQNSGNTIFSSGRGHADFGLITSLSKSEAAPAVALGTAILTLYMHIIRQLQSALYQCYSSDADAAVNAVHYMDQAVAYYVGSSQGADGTGSGYMLYEFANERAADMKTAGNTGDQTSGTALVNLMMMVEFKKAQMFMVAKDCDSSIGNVDKIIRLMKVPLVQGLMRAAYLLSLGNPDPVKFQTKHVEAATYTTALLPYFANCSQTDADTVYNQLRFVGSTTSSSFTVDFPAIKDALERNYACLGMTCRQVGGVWMGSQYGTGAEPCEDSSVPDPGSSNTGNTLTSTDGKTAGDSSSSSQDNSKASGGKSHGAGFGVVLVLGLICVAVLGVMAYRRRRFYRQTKHHQINIAAVTCIS